MFQSPQNPIILGLPWLEQHNPSILWTKRQILHWSDFCLCSMPVKRRRETSANNLLPSKYQDLAEAFSKVKASYLPPHRPSDCAIDLLPGSQPPKGRVFPLSQPEAKAMKSYIEEELAKGFIRPSMSHQQGSSLSRREREVFAPVLTTGLSMLSPASSVTLYQYFLQP